ncbi:MAG: hypothetical protein IKP28_04690 [Clostridia bacterium]|nr:hypothetical protein [Clostridia bacterium]
MNRWFDRLPIIGSIIPGKIVLSFLMLLFAVFTQAFFKNFESSLCIVAMGFSFLGDVALNHKKDHSKQTKNDLIIGGIAFVLAHMFYCATYFQKIQAKGYQLWNFGACVALAILGFITVAMLITRSTTMNSNLYILGLAYLWLTGVNYTTIFSYAYSVKSIESLVALGGLMFLASDVIIGLEKFSGLKSGLARELVWWLYPIGQIIIIAIA